jgi:hypothetical protein
MAKSAKAADTGTQVIGKAFIVYGTVKAIAPDGTVRILGPNTEIYADERIVTESDGGISVMLDGPPPSQIDIGRMSDVLMNEDVYAGAQPEAVTDASADAEKIQEALEGKGDIELDATAAGGAQGTGGATLVQFSLTGEEGNVTSGAETTGPSFGAVDTFKAVSTPDGIPTAGETAADLDEDGLVDEGEGHMAITTGTLPHDFGPDGAGSISLASMNGTTGELGTEIVTYSWDAATNTLTASSERGEIFTVVVDPATGAYTLELLQNVLHTPGDGENDASVVLTYTVTDGNGTSATGTLTISIIDDTPMAGENTSVPLDEDALVGSGHHEDSGHHDNDDGVKLLQTSDDDTAATASGTLAHNYGADGAGTVLLTGVDLPEDAGFTYALSQDGLTLTIYQQQGNEKVDVLEIKLIDETSGQYDVTLLHAIHSEGEGENNEGPFTIQYEVTDSDGDTADGTLAINVTDDVPSVDVSVHDEAHITLTTHDADTVERGHHDGDDHGERAHDHATADFSGAFKAASDYGADGPGTTTWSYSLSITGEHHDGKVNSGLESDGHHIYLYEVDGKIIGSTEHDGPGSSEDWVFSISVDHEGEVKLTQYQAIDHEGRGDTHDYDDQLAVLGNHLVGLTGTATITDGDGDTNTDSVTIDLGGNIRFADDGPSVEVGVHDEAHITLTTYDAETIGHDSDTAKADFSDAFKVESDYGADGHGNTTMSYSLSVMGVEHHGGKVDSGLNSGGKNIYLYEVDGKIIGSTEDHAPRSATGDSVVFSISVVAHGEHAGEVTLTQYQAIDHALPGETHDFDDQLAVLDNGLVGLTGTATITDGDGDTDTASKTIDLGGNISFADDGPVAHYQHGHFNVNDNILSGSVVVNTGNADDHGLTTGLSDDHMIKITVDAPDSDHGHAQLNFNTNEGSSGTAFGITSDHDGNESYSNEINYLGNGKSEVMSFELQNGHDQAAEGKIATSATVLINVFYSGEDMNGPGHSGVANEVGSYALYNNGHQVQGPTTFTANSTNGTFTLNITGPEIGFDEIRFSALQGDPHSHDPDGGDSSDYNVKQVTFNLVDNSETGNLLTGSATPGSFGADGGHVETIVGVGTATGHPSHLPDNSDSSGTSAQDGYDLQVTGKYGGTLQVDSNDGDYIYTPPAELPTKDVTESFSFTLIDGDGDTSSAQLDMLIKVPDDDPGHPC